MMSIRKHVVLVDEHGGPLAGMAPRLKELGFQILLVSDPNLLFETIRDVRKYSLVVINGAVIGRAATSFVSAIKEQHPELPVLFTSEAGAPVEFHAQKPDVVFSGPVLADTINEQAIRLLRESLYPNSIVDALKTIAAGTLSSFGRFTVSKDPFLKASRTLLLSFNAVIPLTGSDHMAGHLLVSAKEEVLRSCYSGLFNSAPVSIEVLEDLVGEMSNMMSGGIKAFIEKKGTSLLIGVPTFIRGQHVSFRRGITTPSLTVGATCQTANSKAPSGEDLFVELYFERVNPGIFDAKAESSLLESDEITFL